MDKTTYYLQIGCYETVYIISHGQWTPCFDKNGKFTHLTGMVVIYD